MKGGLSEDLLKFVVLHVDSVELIEVLLLLRSRPSHLWTVPELDAMIRSTPQSISNRLEHLTNLGLASVSTEVAGTFRYDPADEWRLQLCDNLAHTYQTRRVEIIELIYMKPMKEIVSFSNAFKLRGLKKNG